MLNMRQLTKSIGIILMATLMLTPICLAANPDGVSEPLESDVTSVAETSKGTEKLESSSSEEIAEESTIRSEVESLTFEEPAEELATVIFLSADDRELSRQQVSLGKQARRPKDPERNGYIFLGWATIRQENRDPDNYIDFAFDFDTPITQTSFGVSTSYSLRLWAWYRATTVVRFHYEISEVDDRIVPFYIDEGQPLVIPDWKVPVANYPKGKYFIGWNYADGSKATCLKDPIAFGETLDLYADWAPGFTITYIYDIPEPPPGVTPPEGLSGRDLIPYPKDFKGPIEPHRPVLDGQWILRWIQYQTDSEGNEIEVEADFDQILRDGKDVRLIGIWEPISDLKNYQVTLDLNGGTSGGSSSPITIEVQVGKPISSIPFPDESLLVNGSYAFGGWCYDADGTLPVQLSKPITKDITLYASWGYLVQFEPGEGNMDTQQFIRPGNMAVPPSIAPRSSKYTFLGWTPDTVAGPEAKIWDFWTPVKQSMTLKGVWAIAVRYDTRGGSPTPEDTYLWQDGLFLKRPSPDPFLSDDHKFLGWYIDNQTPFYFQEDTTPTPVSESMTLFAKYERYEDLNLYKLSIIVQPGGELVAGADGYYESGSSISLEVKPLNGYQFNGWESNAGGTFSNLNSPSTQYIMPENKAEVTAKFVQSPSVDPPDSGEILIPPPTSNSSGGSGSGHGNSSSPTSGGLIRSNLSNTAQARASTAQGASFPLSPGEPVTGTTLQELIQQNQVTDIHLKTDYMVYTFPKGTLKALPGLNAYNFSAEFNKGGYAAEIARLTGDKLALHVHFYGDGDLPAPAQLRIYVGNEYAGQTLYYCLFEPQEQQLEFLQETVVDSEGWADVQQTHFSDYVFLTQLSDSISSNIPASVDSQHLDSSRKLPSSGLPKKSPPSATVWSLFLIGFMLSTLGFLYKYLHTTSK